MRLLLAIPITSHLQYDYIIEVCFKCSLDSLVFKDEILEVAGKIYKAGMSLLVIDTENKFVSTGFAKEIARVAKGTLSLSELSCSSLPKTEPNFQCFYF